MQHERRSFGEMLQVGVCENFGNLLGNVAFDVWSGRRDFAGEYLPLIDEQEDVIGIAAADDIASPLPRVSSLVATNDGGVSCRIATVSSVSSGTAVSIPFAHQRLLK